MILAFTFASFAASAQSYNWKPVTIKGGGFVTGIIPHPNASGVMYCRTDIGGAYRWNPTNSSWIPILDFIGDVNDEIKSARRGKHRSWTRLCRTNFNPNSEVGIGGAPAPGAVNRALAVHCGA